MSQEQELPSAEGIIAEIEKQREAEHRALMVERLREAADRLEQNEEGLTILFAIDGQDRMSRHYSGNSGALCTLLLFLQKSMMERMP